MGISNLKIGDKLPYTFINDFRTQIERLYNQMESEGYATVPLSDLPIPDVSEGYSTSIYKIREILNNCEENINLMHQMEQWENPYYISRHIWAKKKIPYQQVEYIESDGNQYILTDIIPNGKYRFVVEFLTNSDLTTSNTEFGCIFGSRESSGVNDFQLTTYGQEGKGTLRWGASTEDYSTVADITKGTYQKASLSDTYTGYDVEYESPQKTKYRLSIDAESSGYPISIFGLNNAGDVAQMGNGARIYSLRFYDDKGDLCGDFIPCRKEDVYGLYDCVSGKFYKNLGTGDFSVGSDITEGVKEKVVRWINWIDFALKKAYGVDELLDINGEQIFDIENKEIYVEV